MTKNTSKRKPSSTKRSKTKTTSRTSRALTVNTNYARAALLLLALNVLFTGYAIAKLVSLSTQ